MTQTLTAPAPAPTREAFDKTLAKLEPLTDKAIALATEIQALHNELNGLIGQLSEELPEHEMDKFLEGFWASRVYKRLEQAESIFGDIIWS